MKHYPNISTASGSAPAVSARPAKAQAEALGKNVLKFDRGSKRSKKPTEKQARQKRENRLARFAAKRTAAKLLREVAPKMASRISACCYVNHADKVTLSSVHHANGEVSALWSGLVTCKNTWACSVCADRIAQEKRAELNALLQWARAKGDSVLMLTLTHRHKRCDVLADNLEAMRDALTHTRQSKGFRALPLVGNVSALEVTHGQKNGWHVHHHILLVSPLPEPDAIAAVEGLRGQWSASLAKVGHEGNEHAFQVQGASAAGEYIAKSGAAEEIALGHKKQGRKGSRTPFQLLADARDGDAQAGALFVEYALAFRGRRQHVWSKGLKALAGIEDAVKAQAEAEQAERSEPVEVRSWTVRGGYWDSARRRRCALSDAVETGSCLDAAEFGPTDAERWREALQASQVLEDDPREAGCV